MECLHPRIVLSKKLSNRDWLLYGMANIPVHTRCTQCGRDMVMDIGLNDVIPDYIEDNDGGYVYGTPKAQ